MLVFDTNALSEPLRRRPLARFMERLEASRGDARAASSVSVFELRRGCQPNPNGERLWSRIVNEVLKNMTILTLGEEEALRAGEIQADLISRGQTISNEDVLIAATALVRDLPVVTRNVRHFARIPGLAVLDWWK